MRILQLASCTFIRCELTDGGWSLPGRVSWRNSNREMKAQRIYCVPAMRRVRGFLSRARNATRETRSNPVTPINTRYYTIRRTARIYRTLYHQREWRFDEETQRNYERIAVSCQKEQKAPSFLFRRHNATSNVGWIKLMLLGSLNRVFHRAKEINETVLC